MAPLRVLRWSAFALAAVQPVVVSGSCLQQSLRFDMGNVATEYSDVCCQVPQSWAEPSGTLSDVGLWAQLPSSEGPVTFYDAKCGKPLFRAPIGRSMAEFKAESEAHGWPSFRDEELVKENIVVKPGGEVVSTCGTHLGHNLPDGRGHRYCIDLLCIAGNPSA
mmetsp:Transcript_21079/g.33669  ORF Transcript_21079/g.33669 Transcript_21079/m.33669 type:complete len:163 (+) Transcript_21079:234-722(+)